MLKKTVVFIFYLFSCCLSNIHWGKKKVKSIKKKNFRRRVLKTREAFNSYKHSLSQVQDMKMKETQTVYSDLKWSQQEHTVQPSRVWQQQHQRSKVKICRHILCPYELVKQKVEKRSSVLWGTLHCSLIMHGCTVSQTDKLTLLL